MKKWVFIPSVLLICLSCLAQSDVSNPNSPIMESIAPNLFVYDMSATVAFYETLGFQIAAKNPPTDNPDFVLMTYGNITFMFQTFDSLGDELPIIRREKGSSLLLYIQLENIQVFYKAIKGKVPVYRELEETFYGATEFSIVDNNNYLITFAEHPKN